MSMKRMKRIIKTIRRIICERPSVPRKLGERILILLNAPSANLFLENEANRKLFNDYDIAVVNYMPMYAEQFFFEVRPRYWIIIDPGFYLEENAVNDEKQKVLAFLEQIDWKLTMVTSQLAEFNVMNSNIEYIKLPCINIKQMNFLNLFLAKRNYITYGLNNVAHAAIFFGITFGYRDIALIGFEYKMEKIYMDERGLVYEDYAHFYSTNPSCNRYSYEEINSHPKGILIEVFERKIESLRIFKLLREYADKMGAKIVNYTPDCCVEYFETRPLKCSENV